jgi:hypothetical protein
VTILQATEPTEHCPPWCAVDFNGIHHGALKPGVFGVSLEQEPGEEIEITVGGDSYPLVLSVDEARALIAELNEHIRIVEMDQAAAPRTHPAAL